MSRDDTARTINAILSSQIERLLVAPSAGLVITFRRINESGQQGMVERITQAARERLPHAIAEC